MKETIRKAIHDAVRDYIVRKGGSITPTKENNHTILCLYGEEIDHEIVDLEVDSCGVVLVVSYHEGEREVDPLIHFSTEEILKITELFNE